MNRNQNYIYWQRQRQLVILIVIERKTSTRLNYIINVSLILCNIQRLPNYCREYFYTPYDAWLNREKCVRELFEKNHCAWTKLHKIRTPVLLWTCPIWLTVFSLEMLLKGVHAGHFFGAVHAYVLARRFRRRRTFWASGIRRQLFSEMMRRGVILDINDEKQKQLKK